jgi:hypothetical protein
VVARPLADVDALVVDAEQPQMIRMGAGTVVKKEYERLLPVRTAQ